MGKKTDRQDAIRRLSSSDEDEGGGFPLTGLISALIEGVMDAGDDGATIDDLAVKVGERNANNTRIRHVFKGSLGEARQRQVEALTLVLAPLGIVRRDGDHVLRGPRFDAQAKTLPDGGLRFDVRALGEHATVYPREVRDKRNEALGHARSLRSLIPLFARPQLKEGRVAELERSMRETGYDLNFPLVRYVRDDGTEETVGGLHREAAAERAGIEPVAEVFDDPLEAVTVAFRQNDGRRWEDGELKEIASHLRGVVRNGRRLTQAQVAEALNVARETVSAWESRPSANIQKGTNTIKNKSGRPRTVTREMAVDIERSARVFGGDETQASIAERLGIKQPAVARTIRRLRLQRMAWVEGMSQTEILDATKVARATVSGDVGQSAEPVTDELAEAKKRRWPVSPISSGDEEKKMCPCPYCGGSGEVPCADVDSPANAPV
jgi:hypothetical protein